MRVAIASSGLGHVSRGIETWAEDLSTALSQRGIDTTLYKGSGEAASERERIVPCIKRTSFLGRTASSRLCSKSFWRFGFGSGYAIEQLSFARSLKPLLKEAGIDILHVQDPLVAMRMQDAYHRGDINTRTILAHGTEEPYAFLDKLDYVQHLAPWRLEDAKAQGCYKDSWTAIPNFVDSDTFCPDGDSLRSDLSIDDNTLVVLCVAAIKRHHKRIDYLIDEFSLFSRRYDSVLVLAGGATSDTPDLLKYADKVLGDRARVLVDVSRSDMPKIYRTGDVFCLASLNEMMPIALIEATASALPAVTNAHPVMTWMTGAGGINADLEHPGELARALADTVATSANRAHLSTAARSHAVANFSKHTVVSRLIEYYAQVLQDA